MTKAELHVLYCTGHGSDDPAQEINLLRLSMIVSQVLYRHGTWVSEVQCECVGKLGRRVKGTVRFNILMAWGKKLLRNVAVLAWMLRNLSPYDRRPVLPCDHDIYLKILYLCYWCFRSEPESWFGGHCLKPPWESMQKVQASLSSEAQGVHFAHQMLWEDGVECDESTNSICTCIPLLQMLQTEMKCRWDDILSGAICVVSKLIGVECGRKSQENVVLHHPFKAHEGECYRAVIIKACDCGLFWHWYDGRGFKTW